MKAEPASVPGRFTLLLDTNEFIALEPTSTSPEPRLRRAADLVRLTHEGGHRFFLSAATARDIEHDKDADRRAANHALARKYPTLDPISPQQDLLAALGEEPPPAGRYSNDDNDLEMLSALWADAVDFLITDDDRLRRRATRGGLADRVFTIAEAAEFLERLVPKASTPPPAVDHIKSYQLDIADPIFASLRDDYPGFDEWLRKARSEHRPTWVIRGASGYAGLMLVKDEPGGDAGFDGKVLKVSTFKVAEDAAGHSYGELLLKVLFGYAHTTDVDTVYVTVFAKHTRLVDLFESFGFQRADSTSQLGELVLYKTRRPAAPDGLDALTAHMRFGPPFVHPGARLFVVPIVPNWHDALFPDYEVGLPIWTGAHPYGNALRKAYVSGSRSRLVDSGDTLLFYRSDDLQAVTVVGVVEDVQVSPDAEAIARFVGRRTVYTPADLRRMSYEHGELHAMVFRQDRLIDPPWRLHTLRMLGVLNGPPQSITEVRTGGRGWVHQQLAASQ